MKIFLIKSLTLKQHSAALADLVLEKVKWKATGSLNAYLSNCGTQQWQHL